MCILHCKGVPFILCQSLVFAGGHRDPPLHFLSSTFLQHNNASLVKGRCRVYEAEGLYLRALFVFSGGRRDPPLQLLTLTLVFFRVVGDADPYIFSHKPFCNTKKATHNRVAFCIYYICDDDITPRSPTLFLKSPRTRSTPAITTRDFRCQASYSTL